MIRIWFFGFCVITLGIFGKYSLGFPVTELTREGLKVLLETVPTSERRDFILRNTELGYKINVLNEAWLNKEEAAVAVQIFNYVVKVRQVTNRSNIANLGTTVCFPDPVGCFDPDDPPFRPV